jgi:hypothetical protein
VGGGDSSPELLADGKGEKTRTAAAFSNEVGAPVAGGVLHWGGEGEEAQAQVYPAKKAARGVLGAPLIVEGFAMAEAAGQRRWRARTEARRSDSDVVGFGHGRRHGRDARGEARRGRRRQHGGVFRHGRSERLLTCPGASGHRRPWQPTRAQREATLPLTAGPHTSAFFCIKNYSRTKIAQNK